MKTITTLAATLGAAIVLAGAPALASESPTQVGPVHIDGVQLTEQAYSEDRNSARPISVGVAFTNDGHAAATSVTFALESHGVVVDRFNDVGSFAQGVRISHRFPTDALNTGDEQLAVAKVTFADGTVWSDSALAEPSAPAQSVGFEVTPDPEY